MTNYFIFENIEIMIKIIGARTSLSRLKALILDHIIAFASKYIK